MATQTIEFLAETGLTLTLKLFAFGSDTVVDSQSATERTNAKGVYAAAFTDVAAGTYRAVAYSSSTPKAAWSVVLTLTTATFIAYEAGIPSIKAQTDKLTFDGVNNIASITRAMSQAALSQFVNDDTGETAADDGSVAKLSQGGSGGGGDATLAKQNEILAAIGTAAVVHAPVITSSLIEVTEGITYDGTFLPKLYWTVTTNYQTADSINLKVWRQEEDGTRTLMKSATATATSATNIEITSFTASFLAALRYQGTPAFDRLQFCLYATEGSNDYEIASGDFHVKERRTS